MSEQGEKRWHVTGAYALTRPCDCTDGHHDSRLSATRAAALLNALEAELEQLRPRAALADEALAKQPIGARWVWVMDEAGVCADCGIDWPGEDGEHDPECILSRYDALPPSQGEGA